LQANGPAGFMKLVAKGRKSRSRVYRKYTEKRIELRLVKVREERGLDNL
jgi:hypothetical protein